MSVLVDPHLWDSELDPRFGDGVSAYVTKLK